MRSFALTGFLLLVTVLASFGQSNILAKGNAYLNSEQYEKAALAFSDGIKEEPTNLIYQCQLGLALIEQRKFLEAENVLGKILTADSNNVAAVWYSGIGKFKNIQYRQAISRFEKAVKLVNKRSGQYYSAKWFLGSCYANLLKTEGLTYAETDRMFECYEEYLQLQPNAEDAGEIREYVKRKKQRRPSSNVKNWVDL